MGLLSLIFRYIKRSAKKEKRQYLAQPSVKGEIGENKVEIKLNNISDPFLHKTIKNLMILDENNKTHQIDNIEIRHNGIFCIEAKNYTGFIFGDEKVGIGQEFPIIKLNINFLIL